MNGLPAQASPRMPNDYDAARQPASMSMDHEAADTHEQSLSPEQAQPHMALSGQDKTQGAPGHDMAQQVDMTLTGLPSVHGSSQTEHSLKQVPSPLTPSVLQKKPENAKAPQMANMPMHEESHLHKVPMDAPAPQSVQGLAQMVSQETKALLSENAALKQAYVKVVAERDIKEAELAKLREVLQMHVASMQAARSASIDRPASGVLPASFVS